jgi:hypothetical protein
MIPYLPLASHFAGLYCAVQSNAEESPEPILRFAIAAAALPEKYQLL